MSNEAAGQISGERALSTTSQPSTTWRYLGARDAADLAYCARFGVQAAPEPTIALGGAWSYSLPRPS